MKKRSKILISCLMMVILAAAMMTGCSKKEEAKPEPVRNPLTGSEKFDSAAQGIRPVALVVENAPDARPQWGMTDKKYSPDIILQGEVEGGITRTLWFYADYNKLPKKIGPMRRLVRRTSSSRNCSTRFSFTGDRVLLPRSTRVPTPFSRKIRWTISIR